MVRKVTTPLKGSRKVIFSDDHTGVSLLNHNEIDYGSRQANLKLSGFSHPRRQGIIPYFPLELYFSSRFGLPLMALVK